MERTGEGRVFLKLVLFAVSIVMFSSGVTVAGPPPHLILTDAASAAELRMLIRVMEEQGAVVHHFFPPGGALGEVPGALDPATFPVLAGHVLVLRNPALAKSGALPVGASKALSKEWKKLRGVWEKLLEFRSPGVGTALAGDALVPEEPKPELLPGAKGLPCSVAGYTSAYLLGDVSVGILFMESVNIDPAENTENWDTAREDQVVAEIVAGADQLVAMYPEAGLDFFYDIRRGLPTEIEPILHDSGERGIWIRDALEALGYVSVLEYIRAIRVAHGTDWTFAAFLVDSLNDSGGTFPDGLFAFAYLGGPYMVMTYDNDGWRIGAMDTVFVHEMGHIFDALDEYASAMKPCDARSGVLRVENQNSDIGGCLSDDPCLMRANSFPTGYCYWSRGQLGLWDSDGNGFPDLRDTPPQSLLNPVDPDPSPVPDVTLTGRASALPDQAEAGFALNHTLNRISGVEYRLDGGPWQAADPLDGSWGGLCEDFDIALAGLGDGWHQVDTRATATVCDPDDIDICDPPRTRTEDSYPSERFYVNTDCAEDSYEENDRAGQEAWVPAGAVDNLQLCAYDPDRFGLYLRAGAGLLARAEYSNPAAEVSLELDSPGGVLLARQDGAAGAVEVALGAAADTGWHALVFSGRGEAETPYRLVIQASCIDDALEPNGVAATAPALSAGLTDDLQICAGDEDWYRISVSDGAGVNLTLQHTASLGNLDLFLYAPEMTLIGSSETGLDTETVSETALQAGVFYLLARGATPGSENRYDLTLTSTLCLDDLEENNDDPASAGPGIGHTEAKICPGDEDWFRLDVTETAMLRAELMFSQTQGNLDIELQNGSGVVIERSAGDTGLERITRERLPAGTYFLRVFGPDPVENNYVLDVSVSDPILLLGARRGPDAAFDWSDAGIECYRLRRSDRKETFDGGLDTVIDITTAGGETGHDPTSFVDAGIVPDGVLYFYKVLSTECPGALLTATKTVDPYPVVERSPIEPRVIFSITVENGGREAATGITVRDEITPMVLFFTVLDIPAGATDNSSATGGRFNRGYVLIENINLGPGETATVRFAANLGSTSGPNGPAVIRNKAAVTGWSASGLFLETSTDDPSTYAAFDSTDVMPAASMQPLQISIFWNQDVNVDLRVVDPCGNFVGPADLFSAECPAGQPGLSLFGRGGCGDTWPYGWAEAVAWFRNDVPTVGTYEVWLRYTESQADGGGCLHGGLEDVVVLVETPTEVFHRWVVLDPEERNWVHVVSFDVN
jgi:hypothetical protein